MRHQQFQRVLLHARFELNRFEAALLQLDADQFPSEVAKTLINVQKQELKASSASLEEIEKDFVDDSRGASARLVSEYRKMMSRRRHLEVLEKARSNEVPWSLVPSVERLSHQILPNRPVLMTTTPDMNYMVGWSPSPQQPVVTLYLPKLHRANAFLHLLIGHELFHPAIEEFFPEERALIKPKLREDCKKLLAAIEGKPDLFSQHRLDEVLGYALEAWERGLTELMCDMGAASLFGPAALWSISGFAGAQDMDTPPSRDSQFYPSWRLRVRVVLDYIFQVDEGDVVLKDLCNSLRLASLPMHADAIEKSMKEEQEICFEHEGRPISRDPLIVKVYELISESLVRAKEFIRLKTLGMADRWANTCDQAATLLRRLELLVPPSELIETGRPHSQAASMSAIALCCWIERLRAEQSGDYGLVEYRRLCRLMLKAIEDAELKRQFTQWSVK